MVQKFSMGVSNCTLCWPGPWKQAAIPSVPDMTPEFVIVAVAEEIREEIDHPQVLPEPAKQMVIGIDGAFVKAGHTRAGQRHGCVATL